MGKMLPLVTINQAGVPALQSYKVCAKAVIIG